MGWDVGRFGVIFSPNEEIDNYIDTGDGESLYDPANMALAWRVLNWATVDKALAEFHAWWGDTTTEPIWFIVGQHFNGVEIIKKPAAEAQRLWLDKILELAIEAGLVELEEEKR